MKATTAIIAANTDERIKSIGDKVVIWDYSSAIDAGSRKQYTNCAPFHDKEGIVICDGLNEPSHYAFRCDLIVLYEDGTKVLVSSRHVKRTD